MSARVRLLLVIQGGHCAAVNLLRAIVNPTSMRSVRIAKKSRAILDVAA